MDNSKEYAKKHRDEFYNHVITGKAIPEDKYACFMAGTPGAGKTEVANELLSFYKNTCLIDADIFREEFPGYTGANSYKFQAGASWLVGDIFKRITDEGYSFLLDGTFALDSASKNIQRVLKKNYQNINIYFVYQDPLIAWKFVKIRELKEGRHVPKERFINAYFMSRKNIIKVREKFGDLVNIHILLKDFDGKIYEVQGYTESIQLLLPKLYTKSFLKENLDD